MNKFLSPDGVLYLWGKIKELINSTLTTFKIDWTMINNKPDVALKTDLSSVYRYKGSVVNFASLPTTGNVAGDVYNVEATGMNYAWNGTEWDALGQLLEVKPITNEEIDSILGGA